MDVTDYLKYYKMTDIELAKKIMKTIKDKTGLTSTCGIGPNIFLSKVAMDIEAKHNKEFIAKWTFNDIETKLWNIEPLSSVWGIGKNTENVEPSPFCDATFIYPFCAEMICLARYRPIPTPGLSATSKLR